MACPVDFCVFSLSRLCIIIVSLIKVNQIYDEVTSSVISTSIAEIVDYTTESMSNVAEATSNALEISRSARDTMAEARPQLSHMLNETSRGIDDLKHFASHPSLQISGG